MKAKRFAALLLAMVLTLLAGFVPTADTARAAGGDRISISMYMWDRSMFKELSPWL